ncbi:MAG: alpha/beta hydrolase [Lachnospiraceae bacterium]|nr:alpha/beta hydrolase [Lachnospiraceae bacterium]
MQQFKLDDSPITYYISGREQGEWCLFLHAAFVDHNMFKTQIEYFADKYNILAVDIIGHGQSTDTKKGDSIDKMSEWIYDIMKAENIEKVHIVGVSLGSVLAQDFANRYPDSVSSLACFGGYDINNFDTKMQKENGSSQMLMMLKAMFSVKWFAKANKKISAYTEQAQNEFYDMNVRFPKKSFMYLASLNSMVNTHQTKQRMYPLLIGCGKYDIPMELAAVEMWKSTEPQAEVVIFENAGHCVNMDVPRKFNEVMEKFWGNSL